MLHFGPLVGAGGCLHLPLTTRAAGGSGALDESTDESTDNYPKVPRWWACVQTVTLKNSGSLPRWWAVCTDAILLLLKDFEVEKKKRWAAAGVLYRHRAAVFYALTGRAGVAGVRHCSSFLRF